MGSRVLRRPVILIAVLAFASLAGGWLAIPRDVERIEMLARDGKLNEAVELADEALEAGSRDERLVELIFSLNNRVGRIDRATEAMDMLLERAPQDVDLWRRAVNFFALEQNLERKIEASTTLARLSLEPRDIASAAGLLSLHSRFEEEVTILRDHSQYLTPDLGVRLAAREAALGNTQAAADAAMLVLGQEAFNPRSAPFLTEILLAADQPDAVDTLINVVAMSEDMTAEVTEEMVIVLAASDEVAAATKLAAAVPQNASVRPHLVWQLALAGRLDVVASIIAEPTEGFASRAMAREFVDAAIAGGQGSQALAIAADMLSLARHDHEVVAGLALTARLYEQVGYQSIAPLRGLVGAHTQAAIAHEPVLLASILADEGDIFGAARVLSQSDPQNAMPADVAARLLLQQRLSSPAPRGAQR